jgi:Ni,Fe-hydrogenase I large subunit
VHWVRLTEGQVDDYRILAPTEWNFHPDGALAAGLLGLPADADLASLARLLVDAIDPCVESSVEVIADA